MLTPTAEWLLDALKNDPGVRSHFDMRNWISHNNLCETTGCIAGWAIIHNGGKINYSPIYVEYPNGVVKHRAPEEEGARLLGLSRGVAAHLFRPWEWKNDLLHRDLTAFHINTNRGATAEHVERMRDWAKKIDNEEFCKITPDQAHHALHSTLIDHPGYVDWMAAFEEA